MRLVMYTNSVSAHQLPLARELVKRVGTDNFRYIYTGDTLQGGNQEVQCSEPWISQEKVGGESRWTEEWLKNCDVLLVGGLRPIDLLEYRSAKGLRTFYQSERWFKPIPLKLPIPHFFTFHFYFLLPGVLRLLVPSYRRMAKRFVKLMNDDPNFITLPIGPWAKKDFLRLGVRSGKMRDWGYFVEPSKNLKPNSALPRQLSTTTKPLRVLWVGRMLWWKRVDTIIKAIKALPKDAVSLTVVGDGEEKSRLRQLAAGADNIFFRGQLPINEIREVMRSHDVYVLSSNAMEGWGAALSEAMEEGLVCYGSREAGASASLLPPACQFKTGDWLALSRLLRNQPVAKPDMLTLDKAVDLVIKGASNANV